MKPMMIACRPLGMALALLLSACAKPGGGGGEAPPSASPDADGSDRSAAAAPGPSVTRYGVAECDKYVSKYLACVEGNVSGEDKEKLLQAFEANQTRWRALATIKEGAGALGIACRAAEQKSREELSVQYGCEF